METKITDIRVEIGEHNVSIEQLVQAYQGSLHSIPAEASKCYAMYKTNEGPEYMVSAMWHPDTVPGQGERLVPGFFIPDSVVKIPSLDEVVEDLIDYVEDKYSVSDAMKTYLSSGFRSALKKNLPRIDEWKHALREACHRTGMEEFFVDNDPAQTIKNLEAWHEHMANPVDSSRFQSTSEPESGELYQHVDGGIYRFVIMTKDVEDQSPRAVYEHLWPFETAVWDRPFDEWRKKFRKILPEVLVEATKEDREKAQKKVTEAKSRRRMQEALASTEVLCTLENKPVFEGSVLYGDNGRKFTVCRGQGRYPLSLNPNDGSAVRYFAKPYHDNGQQALYWEDPTLGKIK